MSICAFVNVNKGQNMTSSDAVVVVRGIMRRVTGERYKVGHMGTLDPMATGVLPVAIGKATKLFDFFSEKRKTYIAEFVFGSTTDTLDAWGVETESGGRIPTVDEVNKVLPDLIGEVDQIPPSYSAKSIDGKRAYEYARKGVNLDLPAKKVNIYDIKLLSNQSASFKFEITCGAGTYIRAIARDIATALGTYGHMSSLLRTKSGIFNLENSVDVREFEKNPLDHLISMEKALSFLPFFEIRPEYRKKVLNGVKVKFDNLPQGDFVATIDGNVIGIANNINNNLVINLRL